MRVYTVYFDRHDFNLLREGTKVIRCVKLNRLSTAQLSYQLEMTAAALINEGNVRSTRTTMERPNKASQYD